MNCPRFETLRLEFGDSVARLTLNRPERLNALSRPLLEEMVAAVDWVAHESQARVLVLRGAGRAFSSGADLVEGIPGDDAGLGLERFYNPLIERMMELPMPVVAGVQGPAAGAGCALALTADIVVAARSAYFLMAFV